MTGNADLTEPDVDYITGGPERSESKYVSQPGAFGRIYRERRETMVDFLTAIPAPLRQEVRAHSKRTGESVRDLTARGLRLALENPQEYPRG
jgi:hypothetical protein